MSRPYAVFYFGASACQQAEERCREQVRHGDYTEAPAEDLTPLDASARRSLVPECCDIRHT